MTTIQGIKFDDGAVLVSVGFLKAADAIKLFSETRPKYVEAYEPRLSVWKAYRLVARSCENFVAVYGAVGSENGKVVFEERRTRSTVRRVQDDDVNKTVVNCTAMKDVLSRIHESQGRIDWLLLNCEGSEFDIIDYTPLDCFTLCDNVFVQFHAFLDFLDFENSDVERCLNKLKTVFTITTTHKKYTKYRLKKR